MARVERDEIEGARDRLKKLLHFTYMLLIPVFTAIFVLADTIQVAIFEKSTSEISAVFRLAAILIVLLAIGVLVSWLLNHMGKKLLTTINLTVGWVVHIGLLVLLSIILGHDLYTIIISEIVTFLIYDIMCMFMILKMLKLHSNILLNIGIPFLASGVAGLILLALDRILINVIGEILTLLISVIVFAIIYVLLMVVLRGIRTHELENVPLGRFFISFSSRVQHDSFYEE